jgi:hypothetical protein
MIIGMILYDAFDIGDLFPIIIYDIIIDNSLKRPTSCSDLILSACSNVILSSFFLILDILSLMRSSAPSWNCPFASVTIKLLESILAETSFCLPIFVVVVAYTFDYSNDGIAAAFFMSIYMWPLIDLKSGLTICTRLMDKAWSLPCLIN